ncbi:MAG: PLP-dependent aspartate aminotransferase family protein [Oscillospiraceae bacterium]|jgi:cystathionine gamma-synthase|nr:PLP-dependent aspartate aminotransferase family protein [Oscillospiraceae bacterium]
MHPQTLCVHGGKDINNNTGAVTVPVYQCATFAHPALGETTGYDYSRQQNPTREVLEKTVAALEEAEDCLAFATGMAAITCLLELLETGDEVIASDDLYGGSVRLLDRIGTKHGLGVTYIDTGDLAAVSAALTPKTRLVLAESPSNPMMHISDIRALADLFAGREIIFAVDNTFLTPYFCRPLTLGADVVIHSGTKYLGGHNDALAGFLAVNDAGLSEKLRFLYKSTGAILAPWESYLLIRGIKTLALRMDKAETNALEIASWLQSRPEITCVRYAGLPDAPGYDIISKQASGFGAMISFDVDTPERAAAILGRLKLIRFAESLGGVESLMTYPLVQTHADVPEEIRAKLGLTDRLLRLSVGIENAADLIYDIEQAINN